MYMQNNSIIRITYQDGIMPTYKGNYNNGGTIKGPSLFYIKPEDEHWPKMLLLY